MSDLQIAHTGLSTSACQPGTITLLVMPGDLESIKESLFNLLPYIYGISAQWSLLLSEISLSNRMSSWNTSKSQHTREGSDRWQHEKDTYLKYQCFYDMVTSSDLFKYDFLCHLTHHQARKSFCFWAQVCQIPPAVLIAP
jgi:hypothetical protein